MRTGPSGAAILGASRGVREELAVAGHGRREPEQTLLCRALHQAVAERPPTASLRRVLFKIFQVDKAESLETLVFRVETTLAFEVLTKLLPVAELAVDQTGRRLSAVVRRWLPFGRPVGLQVRVKYMITNLLDLSFLLSCCRSPGSSMGGSCRGTVIPEPLVDQVSNGFLWPGRGWSCWRGRGRAAAGACGAARGRRWRRASAKRCAPC